MNGGKRVAAALAGAALVWTALPGPVQAAVGSQFDIVNGGQQGERLVGTSRSDRLYGHGGRDRLFGYRSDDLLSGGRGADRFRPGPGADTVKCGKGVDLVIEAQRSDGIDSSCEEVRYQHPRGGPRG